MDYLFTTYTKYLLITTIVLLVPAGVEARLPPQTKGQRLVVKYGVFTKIVCVLLLLVALFFALALASVERSSATARIAIFSTLGIPTILLTFEIFGKTVSIEGDHLIRSYFGVMTKVWRKSSVTRVTHDTVLRIFRVYFNDSSTLRMTTMMRGSARLAESLDEATNRIQT